MKILVVEDDELNIEIIQMNFDGEPFDLIYAIDGEQAWDLLQEHDDFKVILLDRLIPKLNGMQLLERMKTDERYQDIPVVMQTALSDTKNMLEGIEAGVFYYLTKPYTKQVLLTIVNAAIKDKEHLDDILAKVKQSKESLMLLNQGSFVFSTMQQAQSLSHLISTSFPDPEKVVLGLSEIMINAIEHGNLGITFEEKSALLTNQTYLPEIERRQALVSNQDKEATLEFKRYPDYIIVTVTDQGNGFDWEDFMHVNPERAVSPNGRGIMMANYMSFDTMEYLGCGNKVRCRVNVG